MSFSRLSGYLAAAFLFGIVLHSLGPYERLSHAWLIASLSICLMVSIFIYRDQSLHAPTSTFYVIPLTIFMVVLGIYRFNLSQPSLPRNLIFANPKGLASSVESGHTANHLDPRHWLKRLHVALTKRARERFPSDEAALLTGILYGERDLSKSAKTAFRHAGMTHIIAVSGSNMTIVVVVVMRFLALFHLSRRRRFYMTVLAVSLFTLFVGASAAVARAAIMGLLVEFAPLAGRLIRPGRLLLMSALGFTLWHPWALVFDASFALSFLAMTGLLTFGRLLDTYLTSRISSETFREIITSTIAATLLTTPYSAWAFGSLTLWGLPTGLVALPLIPWTMGLGALALTVPTTSLWSSLVLLPASGCLRFILWIAKIPDYVRVGFLDKTHLPFAWFLVAYILLFVVYKIIHSLQKEKESVSPRSHAKEPTWIR